MKSLFLLSGILFGFLLSRAGATTFDFYPKLFLFEDLQLLRIILGAAATGFIGIQLLKRLRVKTLIGRQPISYEGKPYRKSLIPGSILFGMGWGLAGACPGTALAMLGEGKLIAGFTLIGMILGTYLYGVQMSRAR